MQKDSSEKRGAIPAKEGIGQKRRIVVVDDHPITRRGFAAILEAESDLEVCGEADNAADAFELIKGLMPDAALIDVTLRNSSGIELMKNIKSGLPRTPMLAVSMHGQVLYAERALRAGARGYVMKEDAQDQIVAALRSVLRNELYLSEGIRELMLDRFTLKRNSDDKIFRMDSLSDREMEVFRLIGDGFTTRQIATALKLSAKTIDSHRENLKLKLQVGSAAELVHRAVQWSKGERVMESYIQPGQDG
ncbi:MAG TPA: response regulator transcription factor [Opitutaceae bacterium]|nr:response regulator transcription factor [Opitutaceae bacterium]